MWTHAHSITFFLLKHKPMRQRIIPQCHDPDCQNFRQQIVHADPEERVRKPEIETDRSTVDECELCCLFAHAHCVAPEREVPVHHEHEDRREECGRYVCDARIHPENFNERRECPEIDHGSKSAGDGELYSLSEVLPDKRMTKNGAHSWCSVTETTSYWLRVIRY